MAFGLQVSGLEANKMTYNPLLTALWYGSQRRRAVQRFSSAVERGVYDNPQANNQTLDVHTLSAGAASIAALQWLSYVEVTLRRNQLDMHSDLTDFNIITGE